MDGGGTGPDDPAGGPATAAPDQESPVNHFPHALIGLSPGGFSEAVRNSISSLARDHDHWQRKGKNSTAQIPKGPGDDNAAVAEQKSEAGADNGEKALAILPRHLLNLPPEIHLLIIQHLDFADIVRLRQTCRKLYLLASPQQIRSLFGPEKLHMQLLGHCASCLLYDPFRSKLLQASPTDPGFPLSSRCIECALKNNDKRIRVGQKVNLANFDTVWVCRWCARPVVEYAAYGSEQFHRNCYKSYNDTLLVFFVLGCIQACLGIVAGALAWKYFRGDPWVFAPTVTSFILLWFCLCILIFRGNRKNTYPWTLIIEVCILVLWVPPIYSLSSNIASRAAGEAVPRSTQATLAIFCLNGLFRLFNTLGNVILLARYDRTRVMRPGASWFRKMVHPLLSGLLFWTYPQALEHKFPPGGPKNDAAVLALNP